MSFKGLLLPLRQGKGSSSIEKLPSVGSCCQGQGHGAKGERAKGPPEVVRGEEEAQAECKCEWLPSQPVPDPGGRQVTALGRGGGQGGVGRRFLQNTSATESEGLGLVVWGGGVGEPRGQRPQVTRGRAGGALGGSSRSSQRKKK